MSAPQKHRIEQRQSLPGLGDRIRKRRKELKLTLDSISQRSGLSIGFLSLVERDRASPSLSALVNIAQALDISIDNLVSIPGGQGHVIKKKDRQYFSVQDSNIRYARLSDSFPEQLLNAVEITLPPGYHSEHLSHDGEEFIHVISGELLQRLEGETHHLKAGDSAHFQSSMKHSWSNPGTMDTRLIWVGNLAIFPDS